MHYDCRCIDCRCELDDTSDAVQAEALRGTEDRAATESMLARNPCSRPPAVGEPPLGSHLVSPRWGFTHRGIYAGRGRVIHYAGLSRRVSRGPVEEVSLDAFARNRGITIQCRGPLPFGEEEVVQRARSRLGEDRYRIWSNNCEHFSEWSQFGESRSDQVERIVAPLRRLHGAIRSWMALFQPRSWSAGEVCHDR